MATAQYMDFHQFNETYLHELRAQDVTTEAHFVSYFSKILNNKLRRRLACPEHIKDVQQETLLRAWAAVRAEGGIRQPERFGAFMAHVPPPAMMVLPFRPLWMSARAGTLQAGDTAPDFSLPLLHCDRTVTLSDEYRKKPVVLVFGSYT